MTIPVDMINTEWQGLSPTAAIDLVFSRMMWQNHKEERRIRIVTQANLDCIFEMRED